MITIPEFRRIAHGELQRYPSVSLLKSEAVSVSKIESNESNFEVQDASGKRIQARKLILATGVKEIFPEIDGFAPLYGRSLFNCVYYDGWELRDQPLVIVLSMFPDSIQPNCFINGAGISSSVRMDIQSYQRIRSFNCTQKE
ncbi:hypothetical protein [Paenibacillus sp. B1-33]|uniref:hypothetical protein n=1 Tax=unclassified Paenibacillus TaxID=185978 RepID=UPI003D2C1A07